MKHAFTLVWTPGPAWVSDKTMCEQPYWAEHVAFMETFVDSESAALRGSFATATRLLVVIMAENEQDVMDISLCDPFVVHEIVVLGACTRWLPYPEARRTE
jgi:uncharacterized protein